MRRFEVGGPELEAVPEHVAAQVRHDALAEPVDEQNRAALAAASTTPMTISIAK